MDSYGVSYWTWLGASIKSVSHCKRWSSTGWKYHNIAHIHCSKGLTWCK